MLLILFEFILKSSASEIKTIYNPNRKNVEYHDLNPQLKEEYNECFNILLKLFDLIQDTVNYTVEEQKNYRNFGSIYLKNKDLGDLIKKTKKNGNITSFSITCIIKLVLEIKHRINFISDLKYNKNFKTESIESIKLCHEIFSKIKLQDLIVETKSKLPDSKLWFSNEWFDDFFKNMNINLVEKFPLPNSGDIFWFTRVFCLTMENIETGLLKKIFKTKIVADIPNNENIMNYLLCEFKIYCYFEFVMAYLVKNDASILKYNNLIKLIS